MTSSHKTPVIPRSQSGEAELVELWGIPRRSFANENCLITLLSFAVSTEMASNEHSGYPLKWFKDQNTVRNSYECAICLEVLEDAVQLRGCGHQFCALCIDDLLK